MADAPWRCSECGTINEPVANACRTCGRWPSLFDLQESKVDEAELEDAREEPTAFAPEVVVEELEIPTLEEPETFEVNLDEEVEAEPTPSRWRGLARMIVPLAVVIYLVISNIVNR